MSETVVKIVAVTGLKYQHKIREKFRGLYMHIVDVQNVRIASASSCSRRTTD